MVKQFEGEEIDGELLMWKMKVIVNQVLISGEFRLLRDFLLVQHTHDLIQDTALLHYEAFRSKQLLALKESRGKNE